VQETTRWAFEILGANHAAVIQLADRLDADGHWFGGPTAG
jgi:hypothetical protein